MFNQTSLDKIVLSLEKDSKYDFDIDGEIISLNEEDFVINFDASENFTLYPCLN